MRFSRILRGRFAPVNKIRLAWPALRRGPVWAVDFRSLRRSAGEPAVLRAAYPETVLFYQQALDFGLVGRRNDPRVAEIAFLFLGFLSQDVVVISVLTLDLSCAGEGETLLRSGICFHFRHFVKV